MASTEERLVALERHIKFLLALVTCIVIVITVVGTMAHGPLWVLCAILLVTGIGSVTYERPPQPPSTDAQVP